MYDGLLMRRRTNWRQRRAFGWNLLSTLYNIAICDRERTIFVQAECSRALQECGEYTLNCNVYDCLCPEGAMRDPNRIRFEVDGPYWVCVVDQALISCVLNW